MEKRLYRDELNKKVAGVCAGLADYLNVDVTIIRVLFLLALIFKGGGGVIYLVLWVALPKKPYHLHNPNAEYTVPPQNSSFNPFTAGPVPSQPPFSMQPPRRSSSAGLIAGIILVIMGSFFLLDQLDMIPFFDFEKLWPVILIVVGLAILLTGKKNKPLEQWEAEQKKEDVNFTEADTTTTTQSTDKTE